MRHLGGGGRVSQILEKLSNGWTDWHQIRHTSADLSGMDICQTNCPSRHKGALGGFRGQHSKVWGSCQTAGPIGTNFGSRLQIHLGMDIG